MDSTKAAQLFAKAREAVFARETRASELRSELTRKDAEITRLSSKDNMEKSQQQTPPVSAVVTPPNTRGVYTMQDLKAFLASPTCQEIVSFVETLSHTLPAKSTTMGTLQVDEMLSYGLVLLDEIPLEEVDPQRFGNKAFRKWHSQLTLRAEEKMSAECAALFTRSFGDATRIDYGTGHEVAFLMLLLCITKTSNNEEKELNVHFLESTFPQYFALVRALRAKYRLEPAGSHGVWSLDDYHFLPFVLGSAQLAMQTKTPPKEFLREALQRGTTLDSERDFFSLALLDIFTSKRVAHFVEHSPMLNQLLTKDGADWKQLHFGFVKMWVGEVLGKFPVAQHFVFGPSLPITWPTHVAAAGEDEQQPQTAAPLLHHHDPTTKYFVFKSRKPQQQQGVDFQQLSANSIQIGKWKITATSEPRIGGQAEIDALGFDFPLPEMLFTSNLLELQHDGEEGLKLSFNLQHALRGCQQVHNRKLIKVPMANLWNGKTDSDGRPIKTWREDYDWTFTTLDLVDTGPRELKRTIRRIDYDKLKQTHEPILFYREVEFFEDDLFDLGLSKFTVKLRVMQSLVFALARVFVRVDASYYRVVDSRVFHVFGSNVVLVERSVRESAVADLPALKKLDFAQMNDSNFIAQLLPVVGEVETFEVEI